jgi:hypothetical protein
MFADVTKWLETTSELPDQVATELRHTAKPAGDVPEGWYTDYLKVLEAGIWYSQSKGDAEEKKKWTSRRDQIAALAKKHP